MVTEVKPASNRLSLTFPYWLADLNRFEGRYFVVWGGRGGYKSTTYSYHVVKQSTLHVRHSAAIREFERTSSDSLKPIMSDWIDKLGLDSIWQRNDKQFINRQNGSTISFRGLSSKTSTKDSIRGSVEGLHYIILDEANQFSAFVLDTLFPTARREGSFFLISFNPMYRQDPISQMMESGRLGDAIYKSNFDPEYIPNKVLEYEREMDYKYKPDLAPWIWEGEYLDSDESFVIKYSELNAVKKMPVVSDESAEVQMGVDLATSDVGDQTAVVIRRGAEVLHAEAWHDRVDKAIERSFKLAIEYGVSDYYYDSDGIGMGVIGQMRTAAVPFAIYPVKGSGKVEFPDYAVGDSAINKLRFMNLYAQLAWNVRDRLARSVVDLDTSHGLSLAPHVAAMPEFTQQLTQPVWELEGSGRIRIYKKGKAKDLPSPDLFDALLLAYARDVIV